MQALKNITQTLITLDVADNQVLFILLSQDGSINRKGDGSPDCKDNNFFIGISKDKLFEQLAPFISEEMEEFVGKVYDVPNKKGRRCTYQVLFKGPEIETGTKFIYGESSQGIPTPFRNFTIKAIELTEPWFQAQKQMVSKAKKESTTNKTWWKLW